MSLVVLIQVPFKDTAASNYLLCCTFKLTKWLRELRLLYAKRMLFHYNNITSLLITFIIRLKSVCPCGSFTNLQLDNRVWVSMLQCFLGGSGPMRWNTEHPVPGDIKPSKPAISQVDCGNKDEQLEVRNIQEINELPLWWTIEGYRWM